MIRILNENEGEFLATVAEEKLEEKDYALMNEAIQAIIDKRGKVNWYFEMKNFKGWKPKAFWEELKFDAKHVNDFRKIAMVGDEKWEKWMTELMKPFVKAEYFDIQDKDEALEWLRA